MNIQQFEEKNQNVIRKDAEVMAGMCCTGTECGDLVPVQDIGELLQEETNKYKERIKKMESDLKSSTVKVRTVHKINLGLSKELGLLRLLCVAVDAERRDAQLKLDLEGQIVKQLARRLRQAKAEKPCACPVTSTPDVTKELLDDSEISIICPEPDNHVHISDEEIDEALRVLQENHQQGHVTNDIHEQSTLRLDTPDDTQTSKAEILKKISKKQIEKKYFSAPSPPEKNSVAEEQKIRKRPIDTTHEDGQQSSRKRSKTQESEMSKNLIETSPLSVSKDARPKCPEKFMELRYFPEKTPSISEESLRFNQQNKTALCQSTENENKYSIGNRKQTKKRAVRDNNKTNTIASEHNQKSESDIFLPDTISSSMSKVACKRPISPAKFRPLGHFPKKSPSIFENISRSMQQHKTEDAALSQSKNNDTKRFSSEDEQKRVSRVNSKTSSTPLEQSQSSEIEISLPESSHSLINKDACKLPEVENQANKISKIIQCSGSCDKTNKVNNLTSTSENLSLSERDQRWLTTPEIIKSSLDVLRRSFMSETEDHISIWYKGDQKINIDNSNNKLCPNKKNMCEICNTEVECEENDEGCHNKVRDVKNSKTTEQATTLTDSNFVDALQKEVSKKKDKWEFCNSEECVENEVGWHDQGRDITTSKKTKHHISLATDKFSSDLNCKIKSIRKHSQVNVHKTSPDGLKEDVCDECGFCNLNERCDEVEFGCQARIQEIENLEKIQEPRMMSPEADSAPKQMDIIKKEPAEDSGGSSCACSGACETYYREKLLATLQILENKEETIRIQGCSLVVAEDRIAELTKRASVMKADLDHKAQELSKLREFADSYRVDKSTGSITIEMQDAETQKHIVASLEDNLSMIAELYRECFYETAKQEELIDLLRKSYLDVRLMERNKSDKITRLQNVINTQKRSIEQCQDVVIEVESLKSEISCFLNSSNNDSGMWERGSECGDVGEELADIMDQLRQLQDMLTTGCTCGLEEENKSLKETNNALHIELDQVKQRNSELDTALRKLLDQQNGRQLKDKERELQEAHKKLADVEKLCKEREKSCEALTRQLQQAQVMLNDKSAELTEEQKTQIAQEATIKRLEHDLSKAEQHIQEDLKKLSDISNALSHHQLQSQATTSGLEQQLQRVLVRCRDLEVTCRNKDQSMAEMQSSLEEAHSRGARLCSESRRVTAAVRTWMRRKRQQASEQQEKIRRQELLLHELQHGVEARRQSNEHTSQSETDPCCSNTVTREHYASASQTSYPRCSRIDRSTCRSEPGTYPRCGRSLPRCMRENEIASRSKCIPRCNTQERESGSEMASCSRAPVPPRRQKRQKACDEQVCPWSPEARWLQLRNWPLRQYTPTDELLDRVEHLQCALEDSQRRWHRL